MTEAAVEALPPMAAKAAAEAEERAKDVAELDTLLVLLLLAPPRAEDGALPLDAVGEIKPEFIPLPIPMPPRPPPPPLDEAVGDVNPPPIPELTVAFDAEEGDDVGGAAEEVMVAWKS